MYIFAYFLVYWIIYEKSIKSLVYWSHLDSYRRVFVCSCLLFSAGLLKLNFNDTLVSRKHTFPVNIFNLEGGETKLAHDKGNFQALVKNWTRTGSVVGTSDIVFGGLRVQFSPWVRNFSLSRVSMVSPPSKLKMFTGSVCVLLTSVSLKLIKIKIKFIYATTSSWEKNKMVGERLILFFFLWSELFFSFDPSLSESNFLSFLFFYSIPVGPSWFESIRVDPSRTGSPSWSNLTFVPAFLDVHVRCTTSETFYSVKISVACATQLLGRSIVGIAG